VLGLVGEVGPSPSPEARWWAARRNRRSAFSCASRPFSSVSLATNSSNWGQADTHTHTRTHAPTHTHTVGGWAWAHLAIEDVRHLAVVRPTARGGNGGGGWAAALGGGGGGEGCERVADTVGRMLEEAKETRSDGRGGSTTFGSSPGPVWQMSADSLSGNRAGTHSPESIRHSSCWAEVERLEEGGPPVGPMTPGEEHRTLRSAPCESDQCG